MSLRLLRKIESVQYEALCGNYSSGYMDIPTSRNEKVSSATKFILNSITLGYAWFTGCVSANFQFFLMVFFPIIFTTMSFSVPHALCRKWCFYMYIGKLPFIERYCHLMKSCCSYWNYHLQYELYFIKFFIKQSQVSSFA